MTSYFLKWSKLKRSVETICVPDNFPLKEQQRMCQPSRFVAPQKTQRHQWSAGQQALSAASLVQRNTGPETQRMTRKPPQRPDVHRWYSYRLQWRPECRLQPAEDDYWCNPHPNRAQQQGLGGNRCQASPAKQQRKPRTAQRRPICGWAEGSCSTTYRVGSIFSTTDAWLAVQTSRNITSGHDDCMMITSFPVVIIMIILFSIA